MANALPILLLGGAAAFFLTKKKPSRAIGDNGNGKTNGGGTAEPAIGDTVGASTTPQNGVMWKILKSPGGYTAKWMQIHEKVWHTVDTEFATVSEAKMRVVDMIGLGQIP
jgi:hypothetical protein